jgi:NAD(P) transhydrogenase subunit alpha
MRSVCQVLLCGLLLWPAGLFAEEHAPQASPADRSAIGLASGNAAEKAASAAPEQESIGRMKIKLLLGSLTVFAVAIFLGCEVITKVPPTLHTPLMSGSNAISGITLVGSLVAAGSQDSELAAILGMIAVALATINVVGGFLVTHRMLQMFRRK